MAVQLTCPFCKKEFPFDNGALDAEIHKLGIRVSQLTKRLGEIKALPPYKKTIATKKERESLISELESRKGRLAELKAKRKVVDQQLNAYSFMLFKEIVKDKYGVEEYKRILAEVDEELQAYQASGLMRHEYTRANSKKNVTGINKI